MLYQINEIFIVFDAENTGGQGTLSLRFRLIWYKLCIATFDIKEDTETASMALDKAAGTDKTWNFREFKRNLATAP